MKEKLRKFYADHLFRNTLYLMLNTGVQAALGFVFWIICARLFLPADIGIATSLISVMTLIAYVSLLGFNGTFIRFLPTSPNRNKEINTGFWLTLGATIAFGSIFVELIRYLAPRLEIVHQSFFYAIGFVVLTAMTTINQLTDSIFIALRSAKYSFITDAGVMGVMKIVLIFLFIGFGAYGIFMAAGSAAALATLASIFFLIYRFGYVPNLSIDRATVQKVSGYSSSIYFASLFTAAPPLILPLIVLDRLGPAAAAYYYLTYAVAGLLYAAMFTIVQSFFVEGSYEEVELVKLARRAFGILAAITIPAATVLGIFGPFLLRVFGKAYIDGGAETLILFAVAAPAVAMCSFANTILYLRKQVVAVVFVNLTYFLSICGLALAWTGYGLPWVATAWIVGNLIAAAAAFFAIFRGVGRASFVSAMKSLRF